MSESEIQKLIQIEASKHNTKLFRNNVAQGWVGKSTRLPDGTVIIQNARPLHAGLFEGSGDLIGWRSVTITPDMVGKQIAIFTSVEVKSLNGRPSKQQIHWRNQVIKHGGYAAIMNNPSKFKDLFNSNETHL